MATEGDRKQPIDELGCLALVADDPLAPRVLAWWDRVRPSSADKIDLLALSRVAASSPEQVEATLERCAIAGLLDGPDGGISSTARKWIGTIVAGQLRDRQRGRGRDRGHVTIAVAVTVLVLIASLGISTVSAPFGGA